MPDPTAVSPLVLSTPSPVITRLIKSVPSELQALDAWVILQTDDEPEPVALGCDGHYASVDDPATWLTFKAAIEMLNEDEASHLGFALSADNEYVAIEWFGCVNADGDITPRKKGDWVRFFGSYTEVTADNRLLTIVKGQPLKPEDVEIAGCDPMDEPSNNLMDPLVITDVTADAGFVVVTGRVVKPYAALRPLSSVGARLLLAMQTDILLGPENVGEAMSWKTTEGWAAEKFIQCFGEQLRYCVSEEGWYCWDGRRWARDDLDRMYKEYWHRFLTVELPAVAQLVPDIALSKGADVNDLAEQARLNELQAARDKIEDTALAKMNPDSEDSGVKNNGKTARQIFRGFTASLDNFNRYRNVMALAAKHVKVLPGDFDAHPTQFNVTNGILDLRTGDLLPHDPVAMHAKLVDIEYDPEAACPVFSKFLREVCSTSDGTRRPDIEDFVQLALGYSCLGVIDAQVFFVLAGSGGCGKSTLVEFIQEEILGEYGRQVSKALATRSWNADENRFAKVSLKGTRLALIPETDDGAVLNAATVKEITTKHVLSAEVKHAGDITFNATHTLWLCSNHLPLITDNDDATFRRLRAIPFDNKIPLEKQDRQMLDKLRAERAGVLAWLVRGALAYAANPKALDRVPAASQIMADHYQEDTDPLAEWTTNHINVFDVNQGQLGRVFIYSAVMYAEYVRWCGFQGIEPKKKQTVAKYLNANLKLRDRYGRGPNGNDNGWKGVSVLSAKCPPGLAQARDPVFANRSA